jgi:hypothetical protein
MCNDIVLIFYENALLAFAVNTEKKKKKKQQGTGEMEF